MIYFFMQENNEIVVNNFTGFFRATANVLYCSL